MAVREIPEEAQERTDAPGSTGIPRQRTSTEERLAPVAGAPWLPRGYVPRRVLWDRLDSSTRRAITTVVAPPGAGKTLGVAGWLQHSSAGRESIWISASKTVSQRQLEMALVEARRDTETPRIVVVDDAHQLPSACIRFLDHQLNHDPDDVRLLLLTRWDLALTRLVPELLGHLSVIRGDVLKLSDAEARQLITEHARTDSREVRDAIIARAEGWCAAVVLAARASAASPSHAEFVRRCQDSGLGVADLVAGEVFVALRSRERHLLLCTAAEPVLTTEAAVQLTHYALAGEVLSGMESTGLLVSRVGDGRSPDDPATQDRDVHFRIHPLLLEVTRRRLTAGGVEVQLAHATVLRAARLDLARGDVLDGFRRLIALGEYDLAADVLAEHGARLLANGDMTYIDQLVSQAGTTLEEHPDTWGTIALARWMSGDLRGAVHWSSRVLRQDATEPGSVPVVQALCVRLHRTRAGFEPPGETVATARSAVGPGHPLPAGDPFLALLLLELGAAENWLGDLAAAEQHLSESVIASRTEGLGLVTAEALTHLALTQFMSGRESACIELAQQAIDLCEGDPSVPSTTRARAEVALRLATLQSARWPGSGADLLTSDLPAVPDDMSGRFWHRVLSARLALVAGAVAEAQNLIAMPLDMPPLPDHLQVSLLVERALHALMSGDHDRLRATAIELASADAPGERAWVEGALADLEGDLRRAASLYLEASTSDCQVQPATLSLALVGAAQLHDYHADAPPVRDLLVQAVSATEPRNNAMPFLGWSTHGTRVGLLLDKEPAVAATPWGRELRATCSALPGVTSVFRPLVATPGELRSVIEPTVTPSLSPREHEVLGELARGSTYSDIGSNLFVSENTVKTHVSSLYSKLSVSRRSEALAVARKLHLL